MGHTYQKGPDGTPCKEPFAKIPKEWENGLLRIAEDLRITAGFTPEHES